MSLLEHVERPPLLRVGLVGCGAVGSAIARAIDSGDIRAELTAVCDADESRSQALVWGVTHTTRSMTLPGLIRSCQLVVEATNPAAATSIILQALDGGCDLLVTNPAALLPRLEVLRTAEQRGLAVYVPTGSLVGLEAVESGEQLTEAVFTIEMPVQELVTIPLAKERGIEPETLTEATVIFEGSPSEAARTASPLANMIATFALALPDPTAGRVTLVASPEAKEFSYGIQVRSGTVNASSVWQTSSGRMHETVDGATSLAAMAALKRIVGALKLG